MVDARERAHAALGKELRGIRNLLALVQAGRLRLSLLVRRPLKAGLGLDAYLVHRVAVLEQARASLSAMSPAQQPSPQHPAQPATLH